MNNFVKLIYRFQVAALILSNRCKSLIWEYKKLAVTVNQNLKEDLHLLMTWAQFKWTLRCSNLSRCLCRTTFSSSRCWLRHPTTRWGSKVVINRNIARPIRVVPFLLMPHCLVHKEIPFLTSWKWAQSFRALFSVVINLWNRLTQLVCRFQRWVGISNSLDPLLCITTIQLGIQQLTTLNKLLSFNLIFSSSNHRW